MIDATLADAATSSRDADAGDAALDAGDDFTWRNELVPPPPEMIDPLIIRGVAGLRAYEMTYSPPNDVYPSGSVYWTPGAPMIAADRDIFIDLRGEIVREPIKIWNARNVWILGGTFLPDFDEGGGIGELANFAESGALMSRQSLYPRVAGGNLLQVACSGTLRVEGVWMDARGMNIDAIVGNANPGQSLTDARANKRFEIVNSRLTGFRGHLADYTTYGDGLHADAFQMQSEGSSYAELLMENVVILSGQEGVVANCIGAERPGVFRVRRLLARIDTRFIDPDETRRYYPLFLSANTAEFSFEDVFVPHPQGWAGMANYVNDFGYSNWYGSTLTYYTAPELATGVLVAARGLHLYGGTIAGGDLGEPAAGTDFAPEAHVGAAYVSPWTVP